MDDGREEGKRRQEESSRALRALGFRAPGRRVILTEK